MNDICFINRRVNPSVYYGPDQSANHAASSGIPQLTDGFTRPLLSFRFIRRGITSIRFGISLALILLLSLISHAQQNIRVMSFNIRFDNPADSINSWDNRKSLAVETLKTESPDIIGMQEVLQSQLVYLSDHMDGYDHVGVGRVDGKSSGEYVSVFYKTARFKVMEWGTFWLSATPGDTGSVGWDAALPRICTWVKFEDVVDQNLIFFLNTHFDHMGQVARKESAMLILDFIAERAAGLPVIVTGDFNCTPDQEPYRILTNSGNGLLDACFLSPDGECNAGTFNGFGPAANERIDLILLKGHWKVESSQILKIREKEMYISDHYPVTCVIKNQ